MQDEWVGSQKKKHRKDHTNGNGRGLEIPLKRSESQKKKDMDNYSLSNVLKSN